MGIDAKIIRTGRGSSAANEQGTLHVDGKNSGQCQICAFGKYENGFPLLETMPANIAGQPAQSDDVKGNVRSFGSQDIFSNGNEMR